MIQPLVSIIIPLYNRKHLISRCVKSVCNQTYPHLEIIVVDDGSTDKPDDVLAELACDERVKVLRKPNGGVSSARNAGIDAAQGEYIMFLDSDDAMLPMAVEWCVREAENSSADCVTYAHCHCGLTQEVSLPTECRAVHFGKEEGIEEAYVTDRLFAMWNKLYRRQLLGTLRLLPDVSWGEDFIFSFSYMQRCETIAALDAALVNITPDSHGSLNKRYRPQMFADCLAQYDVIRRYLAAAPPSRMIKLFNEYMWGCMLACVRKMSLLAPLSYGEKVAELRRWAESDFVKSLDPELCYHTLDCRVVQKQWYVLVPAAVRLCSFKSKVARAVRRMLKR